MVRQRGLRRSDASTGERTTAGRAYGRGRETRRNYKCFRLRRLGFLTVLGLHQINAIALVVTNLLACGWGASYLLRRRYPGRIYAHVLAAGQALLIAQVAIGLLLLSDGHRAPDELHYLYGALALGAVLSPWLYAPPVPARRLAWFVGATLFATALAVRAYTTS